MLSFWMSASIAASFSSAEGSSGLFFLHHSQFIDHSQLILAARMLAKAGSLVLRDFRIVLPPRVTRK
ncbi:hypothetical protein CS062_00485 [Roseateles chitinivorans]|uniref:Uncharacterized protein n=1 Tax=Roseateles chitinivorans TaxID=2917965 RepID=A0A2G9CF71_9BURK|nr:hypothetical protein CS062_00485 [Roseateles chitinivorans]